MVYAHYDCDVMYVGVYCEYVLCVCVCMYLYVCVYVLCVCVYVYYVCYTYSAWPIFSEVGSLFYQYPKVIQALCTAYISSLHTTKTHLFPLLQSLVAVILTLFKGSLSPALLDVLHETACIFASNPKTYASFLTIFNTVFATALTHTKTNVQRFPDLLAALFKFACVLLQKCPQCVILSQTFSATVQLSLALLTSIQQRTCINAVLQFYKRLFACTQQRLFAQINKVCGQYGSVIVNVLMNCIAHKLPIFFATSLAQALHALYTRYPSTVPQWVLKSINSKAWLPIKTLNIHTKQQFMRVFVKLRGDPRRFRAMIKDFAGICRSENSADALGAYDSRGSSTLRPITLSQ